MAIDAIIFDMDGTLWDGVECYAQGFNDFFKEQGIDRTLTKEDLDSLMGMEEEPYLEIVLPEFPKEERQATYQKVIEFQYQRIKSGEGTLFDGVKEGLEKLSKKYKLFIVSNCAEYTIDYFMNWAKINDCITDTMAYGTNYQPKHKNIRHLVEKYDLKNAVYVGDTDSDGKQSRLAQLPFAFVSYGFGETENYDLSFTSFEQLTRHFE